MKNITKMILSILGIISLIIVLIVGIFVLSLYNNTHGKVSEVKIITKESNIYSPKDIDSAIDVILKFFRKNYDGCSLKKISYIGDNINNSYQQSRTHYDDKEVIVLISTFETKSFCNGSLMPNAVYPNWTWILARDKNGKWEHIDHGWG